MRVLVGLARLVLDALPDLRIHSRAGAVAFVPLRWIAFDIVAVVLRFGHPLANGVVDFRIGRPVSGVEALGALTLQLGDLLGGRCPFAFLFGGHGESLLNSPVT
jgi:hypothetical protein